MADRTASRMRQQGVVGRTVQISVRFADFSELTRSATMPTLTDVTSEIYAAADLVVLGPGSWFTSVIPHVLVPELAKALQSTSARRASSGR